jgi:hypothetical protein
MIVISCQYNDIQSYEDRGKIKPQIIVYINFISDKENTHHSLIVA